MELEVDKEMDTILRRTGRGVLVGDSPPVQPKHVDADEITAFVDNALPSKTRALYMEHFADCDRCRRILSNAILMANDGAAPAVAVVSGTKSESAAVVPWYRHLFRTPNLAFAMGALVLVFGGLFGIIIFQNRQSEQSVAQVTDSERQPGGPSLSEGYAANSAAPAANISVAPSLANVANTNAVAMAPLPGTVSATPAEPISSAAPSRAAAPQPVVPISGGVPLDADVATGGETLAKEEERQPALKSAPPPPRPGSVNDGLDTGQAEKKIVGEVMKDDEADREPAKRKQAENARSRDLPAAPSKSGPARSGPMNTQQNQINSQNMIEMPVTRSVGGKTFNTRNGAWYDSAYKNQATMNFRRGTDEYKKLDSGLRNIADNLGGTVVLVWKSRAYRIQ